MPALYGSNGFVNGIPPGGLMSTAVQQPGYGGLLGGVAAFNQANPSLAYQMGPWSQYALQMAGNPHAGPYAAVPVPSGSAAPGSSTTTTAAGSGVGGLLASIATNPALAKTLGSSISGLFGGAPSTIPEEGASDADMLAAYGAPASAAAPAAAAALTDLSPELADISANATLPAMDLASSAYSGDGEH